MFRLKPGKLKFQLLRFYQKFWTGLALCPLAALSASCSNQNGKASAASEDLVIDGSSTVYPIVSAMADDFAKANPGSNIIVNKSGTGSGMQKFLRQEIDAAAASRPIEAAELSACEGKNIKVIEVPFAIDGVCVITNKGNTWAESLTLRQLKLAWQKGSSVSRWSDLDPRWPAKKISFFGPTDNHGTYDYFTEAISPTSSLRADVQTNQEYNAVVQAVEEDMYGMGYVGMAYYTDNRDRLRACGIDFGRGPIVPSQQSVAAGSYSVLSRPLLFYVDQASLARKPLVKQFIQFALSSKGGQDVSDAHYVRLSPLALTAVKERLARGKVGTAFGDKRSFSPDQLIKSEER